MRTDNSNYRKNYWVNIPFINNFFKKTLKKNRKIFFNYLSNNINIEENFSVLDVGTTNIDDDYENIFIQKYPYKNNITCLSNQSLELIKKKYPEIITSFGDGRKMIFEDKSFNLVHSNATIEHVGSYKNQLKFLEECFRVSNKYIFIQTPNKYFPLDFHTKIPLIHFFPGYIHRFLLKLFGLRFYSDINNLNLISKKNLVEFMNKLNISNYTILEHKLFGFVSNLILIIRK